MLQGKELEVKLGEYGSASVDVTPELKLKISIGAEVDIVAELHKLAAKTSTPVDDTVVAFLEKLVAGAKAIA